MAVKVEIPFKKSFDVALPKDEAYAYLADVKNAIPKNFPGVEKFEPIGDNAYRWTFEPLSYGGHNMAFTLDTTFAFTPGTKVAVSPRGSGSRLDGTWTLTESGGKTQVTFNARIELELPIPFFLKGMAAPLAQKEITKLFDRYIDSVSKNILA